jgi:oligo-alginate lyase
MSLRTVFRLALGATLAALVYGSAPDQNPGPVVYQPDFVGEGRIFMVALSVPTGAPEVKVNCPEAVTLLDRTKLPAKSDVRRFYFRAVKPAPAAEIVFSWPGQRVPVSLGVWSFDDLRRFRTLNGTQLPRRWPLGETLPELKTGQTLSGGPRPRARNRGSEADQWLALSDDAIWGMQPDSTIPRWHWVNLKEGCPIHGTDVYRDVAFYPWLNDKGVSSRQYNATVPYVWKFICPIGGEKYPTNDFAAGDFTSGEYPDDGIGGGLVIDGKHYGFIAEMAQSYSHQMLRVFPECAAAYVASGDPRYLHKALVAVSRVAVEYSYLATMTQHRHRNTQKQVERFGQGRFDEGPILERSGFTIYCIDQPSYQLSYAYAYDAIWPDIDKDKEIISYLNGKGFPVRTGADVRRFIEENLFAVWMQGSMDGATASNEPWPQRGLAKIAEMLNYRRGTDFMDWLYDGNGDMRIFLPNGYFRDGAPYESTGGYNSAHVDGVGPIIDSVEHLRELNPSLYPVERYPDLARSRRFRRIFDFSMDTVNIGRTFPKVGDGGSYPKFEVLKPITRQNGDLASFEQIYRITKDPKFAWALARDEKWQPSAGFPFTRQEVEREAAKVPDNWNDRSSLQDGYGLAMLRSGAGDNRRALWMMYGRYRGHEHDDIMEIGLDAHRSEILGQMGYPRNWNYWEKLWMTQILARQIPFVEMTATAQLFNEAGPVHVAEALARGFTSRVEEGRGYEVDPNNWQRRTLALIDVDDENFYCLDLYRILGGRENWWSFHVQEDEGFTTSGITLDKQPTGTLAGPDVPYGDQAWLKKNTTYNESYGFQGPMFGFPYLYNVNRGKPADVWSADWALKGADGLHFRLTLADSGGSEAVICDGKSPAGSSPYEMKWVLLHRAGEAPVQTQACSLMELYRGEPLIQGVRKLQVSPADEAGFAPVAIVVSLKDRDDYIFVSNDGNVAHTVEGGFVFAGRFGYFSQRKSGETRVSLIGGNTLTRNGAGIKSAGPGEYRGKIAAVDYRANSITIAPAPADAQGLVGRIVYVTNPARRVAVKIDAMRRTEKGLELALATDCRIGTGKVTGIDGRNVLTDTRFYVGGFRYYHGARLTNAAGSVQYFMSDVVNRKYAQIDPVSHPAVDQAKLATEFPVGSWFEIYDYGVSDEVVWPAVTEATIPPGKSKK